MIFFSLSLFNLSFCFLSHRWDGDRWAGLLTSSLLVVIVTKPCMWWTRQTSEVLVQKSSLKLTDLWYRSWNRNLSLKRVCIIPARTLILKVQSGRAVPPVVPVRAEI